jgi:hypothetical protein
MLRVQKRQGHGQTNFPHFAEQNSANREQFSLTGAKIDTTPGILPGDVIKKRLVQALQNMLMTRR